jgi:hypothetical protein
MVRRIGAPRVRSPVRDSSGHAAAKLAHEIKNPLAADARGSGRAPTGHHGAVVRCHCPGNGRHSMISTESPGKIEKCG